MATFARSLPDLVRRLARREDGATAVEFALVVGPFLFMLFALLEIACIFVVSLTLDNAAMDVSRQIRTGELQNGGVATRDSFRDEICERMPWPKAACQASLTIDVRTFEQWKDAQPNDPVEEGEFKDEELLFDAGGPQSIVLVRAYYRWKLITPFLNRAVNRLNDGTALVTTTISFRNEPY